MKKEMVTTNDILEALNGFSTEMDKQFTKVNLQFGHIHEQFKKIDKRFEEVDKRFERIESVMATKKDLEKLATKEDLKSVVAHGDLRMNMLVNALVGKRVFTPAEAADIINFRPLTA